MFGDTSVQFAAGPSTKLGCSPHGLDQGVPGLGLRGQTKELVRLVVRVLQGPIDQKPRHFGSKACLRVSRVLSMNDMISGNLVHGQKLAQEEKEEESLRISGTGACAFLCYLCRFVSWFGM